MTANDDLSDALARHQVGLLRLSAGVRAKVLALMARIEADTVSRLAQDDLTDISRQRQKALLSEVRRIADDLKDGLDGIITKDLADLAEYEAEYTGDLFRRTLPIDVDFNTPAPTQLVSAAMSRPFQGKLMREWFADLDRTTFQRLRNAIRMGFAEGQTNDQIIRAIRGTRKNGFKDGVMETSRRAAETTVRTAVMHTANAARTRTFQANRQLLTGVQWVSVLDGRTSAICRARDGKVYPVDSGPRPPAHPNCRSTTTPVVKGWRELGLSSLPKGTRASMNGQVAADLTYSDWLRKQDVEFQESVLGKTKAQLFRRGKINLDRFVDRAGNELTLDELRRQEADAWQRAGLNTGDDE